MAALLVEYSILGANYFMTEEEQIMNSYFYFHFALGTYAYFCSRVDFDDDRLFISTPTILSP